MQLYAITNTWPPIKRIRRLDIRLQNGYAIYANGERIAATKHIHLTDYATEELTKRRIRSAEGRARANGGEVG